MANLGSSTVMLTGAGGALATAIAQENGDVHFVEDIYGHDVQLAKVLAPAQRGAAVMVAAK